MELLKLDKWKVHFFPPLEIENNAKFNIAFVLKMSIVFFSIRQHAYYNIAEIAKTL